MAFFDTPSADDLHRLIAAQRPGMTAGAGPAAAPFGRLPPGQPQSGGAGFPSPEELERLIAGHRAAASQASGTQGTPAPAPAMGGGPAPVDNDIEMMQRYKAGQASPQQMQAAGWQSPGDLGIKPSPPVPTATPPLGGSDPAKVLAQMRQPAAGQGGQVFDALGQPMDATQAQAMYDLPRQAILRSFTNDGTGQYRPPTPQDIAMSYDLANKQMGSVTGMNAENRQLAHGQQELDLRRLLGMGELGQKDRQLGMQEAESQYKLSPGGQARSLAMDLAKQGDVPYLQQESRIKDFMELARNNPVQGMRGMQPLQGSNPGAPAGPPAASPSSAPPWENISRPLDDVFSRTQKIDPKNPAVKVPGTIGEFLLQLDNSHPGTIHQNLDQVIGYIRNKWGAQAADEWLQGTNRSRLGALSILPGIGGQHTLDEQARAMMVNELKAQGKPVQWENRLLQPLPNALRNIGEWTRSKLPF